MKQTVVKQKLYEAMVSLSNARSFEETCRRILTQGCRVMMESAGILLIKKGRQGDSLQLEYKNGCFEMQESTRLRPFPVFKWGSPLYAPTTMPMGFLGIGFSDGAGRLEPCDLHAFGRFTVMASWALHYAAEPQLCAMDDSFTPVLHDCSFYVKHILQYNADADRLRTLFVEPSPATHVEADVDSSLSVSDTCLTAREIEVLIYLQAGCSNEVIAAKMCFSVATVKYHLGHIFKKLSVKNRTQAVVAARQAGFI